MGASTPLGASTPPEEVLNAAKKRDEYLAWRARTDLRAPYRVAPEFLQGTKPDVDWDTDEVPLIVFINARSGGGMGPKLAGVLARALGSSQVFDLSEYRPDKVLSQIWSNLQQQERMGNPRAALVRSRLRVLACGGDGTIAWVLKVIQQLDLQPHPPVAIMPLGTGNDLSRSFRWGPEFEHGWIKGHASVYSTLKRVADAQVANLDCWKLRLLLPNGGYKPAKTYAVTELQQQQEQQQPCVPGCAGEAGSVLMEGLFWNYFSVGADAQAAYNFHHLRDSHPALASNRIANNFWYSAFSCTSGWFCGTLPSISNFSRVEVLQPGSSSWSALHIPPSIKALVFVNLQSYAGGRNIWGAQPPKKAGRWQTPDLSDGLIEVVGFHSGYHAMAIMATGAKLANGKRLAQVAGIRLALQDSIARPDGEAGQVFMQLDGEPWMQKVPAGAGAGHITLEIVHAGVSKVLCNATDPDPSPERKMVRLLGKQQADAYLTASTAADNSETEQAVQLHDPHQAARAQQEQQQQLEGHVAAAAAQPAVQQQQDLVMAPPGFSGELPSAAPLSPVAAHLLLQPPARAAYTDGGLCGSAPADTSGIEAAAAAAAVTAYSRRSLDVQPAGSSSPTSSHSTHSTEVPSAVAVIEARVLGSSVCVLETSGDGSKKFADVDFGAPGGTKGVGHMLLQPSKASAAAAFADMAERQPSKQLAN